MYLRYQEEELDYLIVLEKKSEKRVQLITAYPVFFVSAKKDYEKDYQNYIKEIEKKQNKKPVIAMRKPDSPSKRVR